MSQAIYDTTQRASDPDVSITDVSHGFGGRDVLHELSMAVSTGETLAIIGPSGTGKTTLLRLLTMFSPPDTGQIRIDGNDVWKATEQERLAYRRRFGMVFQQPHLFDTTVRRNVAYGCHIRQSWTDRLRAIIGGGRSSPAYERVTDVLALLGLGDVTTQEATSLSGGEAQRVAFARALACDPEYLVLDEPTSDLDPRNTAVIEDAIHTVRDRGLGVVVATHDMHQAERIADRVAVILDGRIAECGPTEQIFSQPEDERVRQFINGELVY